MNKEILRRLSELERAINGEPIPTREEWSEIWQELSELDKSLYIFQAENIDTLTGGGSYRRYMVAVSGYLRDMGLVDPAAHTLLELAAEMEAEQE